MSKPGGGPRGTARRGEGEDDAAFVEAMRGVERLKGPARVAPGTAAPQRRDPAIDARVRAAARRAAPEVSAVPGSPTSVVEEAGEFWTARANGIDRRFANKLRSGKISIDARIDLHGHSRAAALRALDRFVAGAMTGGRRCVLVIHGRGLHSSGEGPTLRDAVREALSAGSIAVHALAASSAPPALGGSGATVVWLRRSPSETNR